MLSREIKDQNAEVKTTDQNPKRLSQSSPVGEPNGTHQQGKEHRRRRFRNSDLWYL